MKIVGVTQARIGSSRLPNKVLLKIFNKTLLEYHLERALKSKKVNNWIVATTNENGVEQITEIADKLGVQSFKGSLNDVIDRFYNAVKEDVPDYVVRITSDCPLIDPIIIDNIVDLCINLEMDYISNTLISSFPDGLDVEVFTFKALEKAWKESFVLSDREHVTPYIWKNSSFKGHSTFKSDNYLSPIDYSSVRLTVDEIQDFEVVKKLIEKIGFEASWIDYTKEYLRDKEIYSLNSYISRNEGYFKSLEND